MNRKKRKNWNRCLSMFLIITLIFSMSSFGWAQDIKNEGTVAESNAVSPDIMKKDMEVTNTEAQVPAANGTQGDKTEASSAEEKATEAGTTEAGAAEWKTEDRTAEKSKAAEEKTEGNESSGAKQPVQMSQEEAAAKPDVKKRERKKPVKQSSAQKKSADLNSFVKDVIMSGAQYNEQNKPVLHVGSTYTFRVVFQENQSHLFDKRANLIYEIPDNLMPERMKSEKNNGTFDMNVKWNGRYYTISGNTYSLSGNKIVVKFNENHKDFGFLEDVANAMFYLEFTATIKEPSSDNKLDFGASVEEEVDFGTNSSANIVKKGEYNKEAGKFEYVLTVTSSGTSRNVRVNDTITGTVLTYDRNVRATSNIENKIVNGQVISEGDKGFTYEIPHMNDGEIITLEYSASVDYTKLTGNEFTKDQIGNKAELSGDNIEGETTWVEYNETIEAYEENVTKQGLLQGEEIVDGDKRFRRIKWEILVNPDAKVPVGEDSTVTDNLKANDVPIVYSGDGIVIKKYEAADADFTIPVSTTKVGWGDAAKGMTEFVKDSHWKYTIPAETSGKPYKYVIAYTTDVDVTGIISEDEIKVSNAVGYKKMPNKVYEVNIKTPEENKFSVTKDHKYTSTSLNGGVQDWIVKIKLPQCGFKESFKVFDQLPNTNGKEMYKDGSLTMTLNGTSIPVGWYTLTIPENKNTIAIDFNFAKPEVKDLFARSTEERILVLNYSSIPPADWPPANHHVNTVTVTGDGNRVTKAEDRYKDGNPDLTKKYLRQTFIGNMPAFQYKIIMQNVRVDKSEVLDMIQDESLRDLFEVVVNEKVGAAAHKWEAEDGAVGGKEEFQKGTVTHANNTFTLHPAPSESGAYPMVHCFTYFLKVKDKESLQKLQQMVQQSPDNKVKIVNTATWKNINGTTQEKSATDTAYYSLNPVTKTVITEPSQGNNYNAIYKIAINPEKLQLNGGEPITVTDTMQPNMQLVTDSVQVWANGDACTEYTFDYSKEKTGFTMTVPDGKHILIEYKVKILGNGKVVSYKNNVEVTPGYGNNAEDQVTITSSAGGSGDGIAIRVLKSDVDEKSKYLKGAEFHLYKKAPGESEYQIVQNINGEPEVFTTDDKGLITLAGGTTKGWQLNPGDMCRLEEIKAPAGYLLPEKPYEEFMVANVAAQVGEYVDGDTINLYNKKETIEISGSKTWRDDGDKDPKRPDSIIVHLMKGIRNKTEVASQKVTAAEGWRWSFTNQPKYDGDQEITYSVVEDPVEGYAVTYPLDNYDIINTQLTEVSGSKTWEDGDNEAGKRPERIVVKLKAGENVLYQKPVEPDEDGNWKWSFSNLDKYDQDGNIIDYTVEEEPVKGYVTTYLKGNIVNTLATEISGTKTWEDEDNRAGKRPDSITVVLYKNGEKYKEQEVKKPETGEENKTKVWSWSFTDLPKYENGKEIAYSITEDSVPGYISSVSGYNLTNTITSVPIRKVDIADGSPLAGAHLQILDSAGKVVADWTSTTGDFVVEGLDTKTPYILHEVSAPESYSLAEDTVFRLKPDGTIDVANSTSSCENGVILVKDKHTQSANTSVTVVKTISYNGMTLKAKNVSFYAGLYYDEECTKPAVPHKEIKLQNASSAEVTFDNLEVGRVYYVGECDAEGNVIYTGEVAGGFTYHAKFTGTNGNYVVTSEGQNTRVALDNQMAELPDGFYIEGKLHVTKKMLDVDGDPFNVNEAFYAGIFDDSKYTKPSKQVDHNILELNLAGESQAENMTNVTLLNKDAKVTLYITEVDETGEPVTDDPGFSYKVTVDGKKSVLTAENGEAYVTITNQIKEETQETTKEEQSKQETKEGNKKSGSTRTSDNTPVLPMAILLVVSISGVIFILNRNRRKKEQ
ncbi:MAG: Cna B-type domain-containing protein [Eubacteriales bacterium]|nr:Cna B-type domain-containing protein [Eubacteriales bacterium]